MIPDAALRQKAESLAELGDWSQATACFETLLSRRPGDPDVLLQLSYVASLAGHYRRAHAHALAAAQATPTDPDLAQQLLSRLRTFNEAPALHDYLERLKPLSKLPLTLLLGFASQLINLNEHDSAFPLLELAKQRDPQFPPSLVARAQGLIYLGRFDEARADLMLCIQRAPHLARAWWLLAGLGSPPLAPGFVDVLRSELVRPNRRPEDTAELAYALHHTLDQQGDYPGAWRALELACRIKRGQLTYRPDDTKALVDALLAMPGNPAGQTAPPLEANNAVTPIFIVGMHRSGTTLLEQMLDGHHQVRGLGELYDFTAQMRHVTDHHCRGVIDVTVVQRARAIDYAEVGRGYLKGIAWRLGEESHFTDKLPSNFLNVGFICQALPQARVLHMRRNPMDVCFSNLRELYHDANPYSYDQRELGAFYRQYDRLMTHWSVTYPGRILDVDYTDLVSNPADTLQSITRFCDLPFHAAMLDIEERKRGVSTASAVAVRQGITERSIPKWTPYADKLGPLSAALTEACPP